MYLIPNIVKILVKPLFGFIGRREPWAALPTDAQVLVHLNVYKEIYLV